VFALLACFAISASTTIAAQSVADQYPAHPIPFPKGSYGVGLTIFPIEKSTKTGVHRRIRLWYPTRQSRGGVPYADSETMAKIRSEKLLDQPPRVFDVWQNMKVNAKVDAMPLTTKGKFPLVFLMTGQGMPAACYTSYAQQLASDGYIVAAIDFAAGGFLVDGKNLLNEDPPGNDESTFGKISDGWAMQASEIINDISSHRSEFQKGMGATITPLIDLHKIAVMGHSLGGAAALEAARRDQRIKACVNLDGIPESYVFQHGISTSVLFLRSRVDYSDEDLKRLHRTRAEWDSRGKVVQDKIKGLLANPGGSAWVISINGTNHVSFSDLPFTAPQTISHYGGKIIDPNRLLTLWTSLVEGFLDNRFDNRPFPPRKLAPEEQIQVQRTAAKK
jgi:dienelactone hydrolase